MSPERTEKYDQAVAIIGLCENAAYWLANIGENAETVYHISLALKLAMTLLREDRDVETDKDTQESVA